MQELYQETKDNMEKSLEFLKKDFSTLRTGQVSVKIIEHLQVDYYGIKTPLNALGNISVLDGSTIIVNPWDQGALKSIEKAVAAANIGVNPNNDGEKIILAFAPMSLDQRHSNVKKAKTMSEKAKVSVRNQRKESLNRIKKMFKDKVINEDESKTISNEVQKITDNFIDQIDKALNQKESNLLQV